MRPNPGHPQTPPEHGGGGLDGELPAGPLPAPGQEAREDAQARRTSRRVWFEVDGEYLPVCIEQGQVRVELPFDVDFVRLAELLRQEGYFYAHDPERVDAQGWGRQRDYEGYYPYWVWREGTPGVTPTRTLFACPPQEYVRADLEPPFPAKGGTPAAGDMEAAGELAALEPVIGPATIAEIRRWIPFLRQAMKPARQGTWSGSPEPGP